MTSELLSTPRADGFSMPAEWAHHAQTWMLFPDRPDNWRASARPAQAAFAQVAAAISRFELVTVGVNARSRAAASELLAPQVQIVTIESDDAWMRDTGPTFVTRPDGAVRAVDWRFNAWGGHHGGLYSSWDNDAAVASAVCGLLGVPRYRADFVLEGGSIHVDGQGTLLTTRECLLNPNRNPHLSQSEIEARLRDYLGVSHIIWLDAGVYLDETDGHIDNLACFVRPGEVLLTWTDDVDDPQYPISAAAYECLTAAVDARGRRLAIHRIHQPDPMFMTSEESSGLASVPGTQSRLPGHRLAGSYVNFYMTNGGIVMPVFENPRDSAALATMQAVFPDRQIVTVPSREILLGGGCIHCITQQQPA